jgi:cytidylate kinase
LFEVITIDGPSGSGKGTLAKMLAKELGWLHLDSGLLYRTFAFICIENKTTHPNSDFIEEVFSLLEVAVKENQLEILYKKKMLKNDILRTIEVSHYASVISQYLPVRIAINKLIKNIADQTSCVTDGRDMGTTVFPDAKWKFYLTASAQIRAHRRLEQLNSDFKLVSVMEIQNQIEQREVFSKYSMLSIESSKKKLNQICFQLQLL